MAGLAVAGTLSAEELEPGKWMMDVYRPDAPLETILITVEQANGGYIAMSPSDGSLQLHDFQVSDNSVWFEYQAFGERCRLLKEGEKNQWVGTCPPDKPVRFDEGLTITLRPPRGSELDVTAAGSYIPDENQHEEAGSESEGSISTR